MPRTFPQTKPLISHFPMEQSRLIEPLRHHPRSNTYLLQVATLIQARQIANRFAVQSAKHSA